MASKYAALAIMAIVFPAVAMATEYVVGDGEGWKVGPNYILWASGKVFNVGDTLVFQYEAPHNVYKVDGAGFKDCKASGNVLNSGNDTITLAQPGKKWYICGYSDHCLQGQKLVINVLASAPTPSPNAQPPASHSHKFSISNVAVAAAFLLITGFVAL